MKTKIKIVFVLTFLLFAAHGYADDFGSGKATFTSQCASCHKLGGILTGPDLTDVEKRRSIDWIIQFVRSPQTVIKNGDKEAVALFQQFNNIQMPDHPDLKDDDIKNIVLYIKTESANAPKDQGPFATPVVSHANYLPLSKNNYAYIICYLSLVAILIGVLFFAVTVEKLRLASPINRVLNKTIKY